MPPLIRALDIVGSDPDRFSCPACFSHDRERHLWLYLQASGLLETIAGSTILHFAPEQHLAARLAAHQPIRYLKADLYPTAADIQPVDLLHMPFADASFNLVLANHVLEHVADDLQGLRELHRVLAPQGWAILQTPYAASLHHTWEDPGIRSPQQRLLAYGQEDHVRLYGQDIFQRIAAIGFEPHIRTHAQLLPQQAPQRYGVNAAEPFMLFRRLP